ncbi:MAG: PTS sugar transporter subunit IIA [Burkholderiaceae bacterium]
MEKPQGMMMNVLEDLLRPDDILLDVKAEDAMELFEIVARHWAAFGGPDSAEVIASLAAREALGTTGLGKGVAIPHARLPGLARPLAVLVRTATPLDFDAPDSEPVSLFFCLIVPQAAASRHLEILALVAERFSNAQFRQALATAISPAQVLELVLDKRTTFPTAR